MEPQHDSSYIRECQQNYVLGTYAPSILIQRGAMAWVWDDSGKRYLDFSSGISVCNLGHCHPRVTEAIQRQAARLVHVSNLFFNENQPLLAERIARHSFGGRVFFCNSGAEANEAMIKLARRWGHDQGKYQIICMEDSFHGRTLATLAATGRAKYRKGFEPDVQGFVHVPFNDIDALKAAFTPQTAAVLLEPLQGEGGIRPATQEFMTAARRFCTENGALLLFDEVQCGMGRTGYYFAHQHYGVEPDAMSLAKALANGFPIGAMEVQQALKDQLPPGTHASTFGGNPLACAAGVAVFEAFESDQILDRCRKSAVYLREQLHRLQQKHACIQEIRGLGLMLGIDLGSPAGHLLSLAREKGLLILTAGETVLRLLPPLTIQEDEIDQAVCILDDVLSTVGGS